MENLENGGNMNGKEGSEMKQKGFLARIGDGIVNTYRKVKANKVGRWAIRGVKAAGLIVGGVEIYKRGQKSVAPVTVYVTTQDQDPAEEEAAPEETPAEEEAVEEEKTEE